MRRLEDIQKDITARDDEIDELLDRLTIVQSDPNQGDQVKLISKRIARLDDELEELREELECL